MKNYNVFSNIINVNYLNHIKLYHNGTRTQSCFFSSHIMIYKYGKLTILITLNFTIMVLGSQSC